MSKRRTVILVAAAAALTGPLLLAPTQTTGAYWNEQLSLELPKTQTQSDTFSMTAGDVPSLVDHSQPPPGDPTALTDVANEPRVSITNTSMRHNSWIDVVSTRVAIPALPPGGGTRTNTLLDKVKLAYAVSGACTDAFTGTYWSVNGGGRVAAAGNPVYTRPVTPPTVDAELTPEQTRAACPWVQPDDDTTTKAGQRAFLMTHAGRQLDIFTTLRQKSFGEGTWTSNQATEVRSRYQVKLPPPTRRSHDNFVCARVTGSNGSWTTGNRFYGRLYWSWPFAADHEHNTTTGTLAINRFQLMRSDNGGSTWYEWRGAIDRNDRLSDIFNGLQVPRTPVLLTVRAYAYSGSTVYVDADWTVKVGRTGILLGTHFTCYDGEEEVYESRGVDRSTSPTGLS